MANEVLDALLRDYEQKKLRAELDLDTRKNKLYSLFPRLAEIENELNSFAIATTKSLLLKDDSASLESLYEKIDVLKKEKESILSNNGYDISFLKPFYECSSCEDTGFISVDRKKSYVQLLKTTFIRYFI